MRLLPSVTAGDGPRPEGWMGRCGGTGGRVSLGDRLRWSGAPLGGGSTAFGRQVLFLGWFRAYDGPGGEPAWRTCSRSTVRAWRPWLGRIPAAWLLDASIEVGRDYSVGSESRCCANRLATRSAVTDRPAAATTKVEQMPRNGRTA